MSNKVKLQPAGKPINVVEATYIDGYKLKLTFSDKKVNVIDFENFLKTKPHPQYNKYNKLQFFKQFKIEWGNIVWGKNWDLIFPVDQLHKGKIC